MYKTADRSKESAKSVNRSQCVLAVN